MNLQNWNHEMRVMITSPDDDHLLIEGDLSQAEARVVTWYSDDEEGIRDFESGVDTHTKTARFLFDIQTPLEELLKDKEFKGGWQRYSAKRIKHATNYEIKPKRFAQTFNKDAANNNFPLIDIPTSTAWLNKYHKLVPNLKGVYHKEIRAEIKRSMTLWNVFGRRIIFRGRIGPDLFREGYAWIGQSTIGDLTNHIFRRMMTLGLNVMHQNHDSLMTLTHKDEVDEVCARMLYAAQVAMVIKGRELVVPMELKIGKNWRDMEELNTARFNKRVTELKEVYGAETARAMDRSISRIH